MSNVEITVRGEHQTTVPAELAVTRVSARIDGPERAAVVKRANELAVELQAELSAADAAGSVGKWNSERITVWADRPWNNEGKQLPLVHHASLATRSEWVDFAALSEWIAKITERDGVNVDGITWQLTRKTSRTTESTVAQAAIQVAVDRARAYASALGLHNVTAVQVADVGLLGAGEAGAASMRAKGDMMMMRTGAGSGAPELEPSEIMVSATVEARFVAN